MHLVAKVGSFRLCEAGQGSPALTLIQLIHAGAYGMFVATRQLLLSVRALINGLGSPDKWVWLKRVNTWRLL